MRCNGDYRCSHRIFSIEAQAASGSCQSGAEGKLDCMDFTGNLPAELKLVCTIAGRAKWVDRTCPGENVLGFCEVPRTDNIRQRSYCYRMAQIPDAQRIEYCRMGCNGTFSTTQGDPSAPATSEVVQSTSAKPTVNTGVPMAVSPQSAADMGPPQYRMEQNTNLFGEDYKDPWSGYTGPGLVRSGVYERRRMQGMDVCQTGGTGRQSLVLAQRQSASSESL